MADEIFDVAIIGADRNTADGDTDLVLTGEGRADRQTLMGKLPERVMRRAQAHHVPTWLVADELRSRLLVTTLGSQGVNGSPIHAMWPTTRDLAPKIRVTVDQLVRSFTPRPPWEI